LNWFDPSQWKPWAELLSHWQAIATSLMVLGAFLAVVTKRGRDAFRWLWSKRLQISQATPSEGPPLRFVLNDMGAGWQLVERRGALCTSVSGHWHVTNVSDRNIMLLKCDADGRDAEHGVLATSAEYFNQPWDRNNYIPAHSMREVSAQLWFLGAIARNDQPLMLDLTFTDNYEDRYTLKNVRFKPRPSRVKAAKSAPAA
jgi:hypothetical protein